MNCPRGKASPDAHTKKRLFAGSGGYCQNPGCLEPLFRDVGSRNIHIAEMAHVFSASDHGPRADNELTPAARGDYCNLILLCSNCHTTVDKAEKEFPDALMLEWKESHTEKIRCLFEVASYATRDEARSEIAPLLAENRTIFETYGPTGEERFNPESELPLKWLGKIRTRILPNNRKLLATLDANKDLMNEKERAILEVYRQHVDDFELKHIGESESSGVRFPDGMESMLGGQDA